MIIKETSVFTRRIHKILDAESYRLLQLHLLHLPDSGNIIPSSGGIRKIRWAPTGSGKRGGARVIYYWAVDADTVLMLFAFQKNERADLTPGQLKQLASVVKEEFS
ncbi:MAG: type II toxin-antitoxin system RelE/ParE family toxin [Dehalococcoidia bacterium]